MIFKRLPLSRFRTQVLSFPWKDIIELNGHVEFASEGLDNESLLVVFSCCLRYIGLETKSCFDFTLKGKYKIEFCTYLKKKKKSGGVSCELEGCMCEKIRGDQTYDTPLN